MRGVGVGARQHRHQREHQRQFAIAGAGEVEANGLRVGRVDRFDERKGGALLRPAFLLQQPEGEHDVGRGDRRAVGEMRSRVETERHVIARVVGLDRPRDQAIERERLVGGARHQRLIDIAVSPWAVESAFTL